MITLKGLTRTFGPIKAVNNITLSVARGEVLGFLGPNGAGKSTTMRMITGYLSATDGTVEVDGIDVSRDPIAVKQRIGYLPEGAPLYGDMTPAAFLDFIAGVRGLAGVEKEAAIAAAVEKVRISEVLHRPIDTLSKGFKRRVGLAQAILHDPDVLILDEPTDGLDPNQKHQVRSLIHDMAADKAIIISTHILEEVEAVCTRAIIISDGSVVFDGTPQELEGRSRLHNAVTLRVDADAADKIQAGFAQVSGVASVETVETYNGKICLRVVPEDGATIIHDLGAWLRDNGVSVDEMHTERGHLADVFRQLTTSA
jgi:ABC-2 type transport system ATP-binding protein